MGSCILGGDGGAASVGVCFLFYTNRSRDSVTSSGSETDIPYGKLYIIVLPSRANMIIEFKTYLNLTLKPCLQMS